MGKTVSFAKLMTKPSQNPHFSNQDQPKNQDYWKYESEVKGNPMERGYSFATRVVVEKHS